MSASGTTAVAQTLYDTTNVSPSPNAKIWHRWVRKVKRLSLRSNYLADDHIRVLGEILSQNHSITHLSLWDNCITNVGAIYLGEAIRTNRTLLYLSMGRNQIGNDGAEFLALSLSVFSLTPAQLFERKKTIRELEKKKKETFSRRRRVSKGKSKGKSEQPPLQSEASTPTKKESSTRLNSPPTVGTISANITSKSQKSPRAEQLPSATPSGITIPASAGSPSVPARSATASDQQDVSFDLLIDELQPIEEDGVAYGKGNRSIQYLNLTHNQITNLQVLSLFQQATRYNQHLCHILLEGNPFTVPSVTSASLLQLPATTPTLPVLSPLQPSAQQTLLTPAEENSVSVVTETAMTEKYTSSSTDLQGY
jgi:hypothetical protein